MGEETFLELQNKIEVAGKRVHMLLELIGQVHPKFYASWKDGFDEALFVDFLGAWEKYTKDKVLQAERARVGGIAKEIFEQGHGGGNWRRLIIQFMGELEKKSNKH